ncbi:MAG: hypothetical protein [Wendovervirus sonii]|uniref:Uncharacterized protein n=1 Tax=phage Lak_Megaphage_Sonny TaxID=3109229 RepID=A0ABZ0Z5F8_9CAUD|nr:MAG: hypothetical protein [phage Lak_Megaphage_Sonny]
MDNLKELLKSHAETVISFDQKIKDEMITGCSILKEYVEKTYIGKYIKNGDAYFYVNSIQEIVPIDNIENRRYRVYLRCNVYNTYGNDAFILLYKDDLVSLIFELDGSHKHNVLENFDISKYHVINKISPYDYEGNILSPGDKVLIFVNSEIKEGLIEGIDMETQKMKVNIPGISECVKVDSRNIIKKR